MRKISTPKLWTLGVTAALALGALSFSLFFQRTSPPQKKLRLYWFIPDGLRAETDVFKIYEWARQGHLPHLKKMMDQGSYGYSLPVFPGHTPSNFATLLTGASPRVHGVADGPMHIEGHPLKMVSSGGFSSTSKRVPPLSYTLEERNYLVSVLSVPGTTPPELDKGFTLKGRWGGWGIDFPAMIFQSAATPLNSSQQDHRVFYSRPDLTLVGSSQTPQEWHFNLPKSYSPPHELVLKNWGLTIYAYVYDSSDDKKNNFDRVLFSKDKNHILTDMGVGDWSAWIPADLTYEVSGKDIPIRTHFKINPIKLGQAGFYRIRFFYDNLNEFSVQPPHWYSALNKQLGPMVDFPDNFPAQLIHFNEDKKTFLEEMKLSLDWHRRLVPFAISDIQSNVIIHNVYAPNQMLTSRWWTGYVDPLSERYKEKTSTQREELLDDVKDMYKRIDLILGEIMKNADDETIIVFSSDHGVMAYNQEVRLNNLFAQKGWLKFNFNKYTKTFEIDWKRTQVVFLQMDGIYINPKGLDGNYYRSHGKDYEKLRGEVQKVLETIKDTNGQSPLDTIMRFEDAGKLGLPTERVGDLIIANKAGYNWSETLSDDRQVFFEPLPSGYKQAVLSEKNKGMWTPFAIMGPGVKKNHEIKNPIHHIDQYPIIMKLLNEKVPAFVEGQAPDEIFER